MPPAQLTCVSCNSPFPLNRELASIPDASTVAFDAVRGRVWRICGKCGEWNLLGAEASAAALPEVAARFGAASKGRVESDFSPAEVSPSLKLIRVGNAPGGNHDDVLVAEGVKRLARKRRTTAAGLMFCAALFAADVAFTAHYHFLGQFSAQFLVTIFVGVLTLNIDLVRNDRPVNRPSAVVGLLALIAAIVVAVSASLDHRVWQTMAFLILFMPIFTWFFPIRKIVAHFQPKWPVEFVDPDQMRDVSFSWTAGRSDVVVHDLPGGVEISGPEGVDLVQRLAALPSGMTEMFTGGAVAPAARELLKSAGGIDGVFRALDGLRRDSGDRLVIASLPRVYRLALSLGIPAAADGEHGAPIAAAAEQANVIASHAEALAREQAE